MPRRLAATNHVNLTVSDLDRSTEWYCRVLGLSVVSTTENIGPPYFTDVTYYGLFDLSTSSYVVGLIQHPDALPDDFDAQEERRWAVEAGMSLDEIEAQYAEEDSELDLTGGPGDDADLPLDLIPDEDDDLTAVLPEELVSVLERELLLLPVRTRLEALVAAEDLVENWSDLLADEEKLLGHLVIRHAHADPPREHAALVDLHAELHAAGGPRHGG
jgi:catechol 2,3-dioxygenase-like lactoylglutathione lyase family enzyme